MSRRNGTRPLVTSPYREHRAGMFHRNEGMRIDLALLSSSLAGSVTRCGIDRDFRKGLKPSDHAPLLVQLSTDS